VELAQGEIENLLNLDCGLVVLALLILFFA
jgi:hypothetical protein